MEELIQKKVGEVVTENIKAAHVFKKYGIDFCCGGGISIEEACKKNGANLNELVDELGKIDQKVERELDYNTWKLDFLIDHIINVHHSYVLESMPIMIEYADKVASVHGHHYSEVLKIRDLVHEVCNELFNHLQKEEKILFPYVKSMIQAENSEREFSLPPFGSANNPVRMMEAEHENAGNVFKELRRLSNDFSPPPEACNTFRALYSKLEEFEKDLHQHIHLENNILFPKAIAKEQLLSSSLNLH